MISNLTKIIDISCMPRLDVAHVVFLPRRILLLFCKGLNGYDRTLLSKTIHTSAIKHFIQIVAACRLEQCH